MSNEYKKSQIYQHNRGMHQYTEVAPYITKQWILTLRAYCHDGFVLINSATKHDQRYNILLFGAIRAIRSLKLNHKKVKNNK